MKNFIAIFMVLNVALLLFGEISLASPLENYSEDDYLDEDDIALLNGMEEYLDKSLDDNGIALPNSNMQKRNPPSHKYRKYCVPRGGNCDHRPKHCCNSGSCRCNLWGSNCKCQRMGFFQRWGK